MRLTRRVVIGFVVALTVQATALIVFAQRRAPGDFTHLVAFAHAGAFSLPGAFIPEGPGHGRTQRRSLALTFGATS
jgi:hypothetical protein